MKAPLELGDIFRHHGPAYLTTFGDSLSREQKKAMRAIAVCRTAALGGHVDQSDRCGYRRSLTARAAIAIAQCAAGRPERDASNNVLRSCCRSNTSMWSSPCPTGRAAGASEPTGRLWHSFPCGSRNLVANRRRPPTPGARIGFLAMLHTWGQNLYHHPRLHCVFLTAESHQTRAAGYRAADDFFSR